MNTAAGMMVRTYVTFRVSLEVMEKQAEEEGDSLFLPIFCLWALFPSIPSSDGSSLFPRFQPGDSVTITCSWSLTPCDRLSTQTIVPKSDERDVGGAVEPDRNRLGIGTYCNLPILTTICSENVRVCW